MTSAVIYLNAGGEASTAENRSPGENALKSPIIAGSASGTPDGMGVAYLSL
jgi:hypothetical protein